MLLEINVTVAMVVVLWYDDGGDVYAHGGSGVVW